MKSADVKPATASKSGPGKPFFSGKGEGVAEGERRQAFFNTGGGGRGGVQTKLTVGEPGDKYERQADATADKVVMRMAETRAPETRAPEKRGPVKPTTPATDGNAKQSKAPPVQMKNASVQMKCAQCEMKERKMKKEEEESPKHRKVQRKPIFDSNAEPPPADTDDKHKIQRCAACDNKKMVQKSGETGGTATTGGGGKETSPDLEARLNSTKGGGQPLPDGTRQHMESSMGADFSGVRVHNNSGAAQMNKDLSAHAFAHGSDIYFNTGKYNPDNKEGQHLLAHELTHVVQQGGAAIKTAPAVPAPAPAAPQTPAPAPGAAAPQAPAPTPGAQPNTPTPGPQPAPTNTKPSPAPAPAGPATSAPAPAPAPAPGATAAPPPAPGAAAQPAQAPATPAAAPGQKTAAGPTKAPIVPTSVDDVASQTARLAKAPKSEYKTAAVAQAANLEKNVVLSRLAINQTAKMRTLEIRRYFAEKKNAINRFFVGTGQDILNAIQQKQLQFMQMSIAATVAVMNFVTNTEQGVIELGDKISHQLSTFIDTISSGISATVNAVAGTITGLISSIPIPDIPGAATIRNGIVSLVNRAAGAVRGVISSVTQALQSALTKVTQIVTGIVQTVGELIRQLLGTILGVIMRIQLMLFMAIRRIGDMILSRMTGFLNGTIFPVLQKGEDFLVEQVDEARLIRLMQLEDNQAQMLTAMADVVDPKKKPEKKAEEKGSREKRLLYFTQVEQVGVDRNTGIVAKFVAETSSFFLIAIHKILAFGEYIETAWQSAYRQFKENISAMVNAVVQKVKDFVSEEIDKIKALFTKFVENLEKIAGLFVKLVSKLKDIVVKLVSSAASSIASAIRNKIRQFVTGGGGDATAKPTQALVAGGGSALANFPVPQLAPRLVPEPEDYWEEVEEAVESVKEAVKPLEELAEPAEEAVETLEEEAAIVEEAAVVAEEAETATEAVAEGWEVELIVLGVVVELAIIALADYLLYLLIQELLKPKPDPVPIPIPVPEPVPAPEPEPDPKKKPKVGGRLLVMFDNFQDCTVVHIDVEADEITVQRRFGLGSKTLVLSRVLAELAIDRSPNVRIIDIRWNFNPKYEDLAAGYSRVIEMNEPFEGGFAPTKQKEIIRSRNRSLNGGKLKSDDPADPHQDLVPPKQKKGGVEADKNEAQVDHIFPGSKLGYNSFPNAQVLSDEWNRKKGNK